MFEVIILIIGILIACFLESKYLTSIGTMVSYQYVFVCVTFLVNMCTSVSYFIRAENMEPEKRRSCV